MDNEHTEWVPCRAGVHAPPYRRFVFEDRRTLQRDPEAGGGLIGRAELQRK